MLCHHVEFHWAIEGSIYLLWSIWSTGEWHLDGYIYIGGMGLAQYKGIDKGAGLPTNYTIMRQHSWGRDQGPQPNYIIPIAAIVCCLMLGRGLHRVGAVNSNWTCKSGGVDINWTAAWKTSLNYELWWWDEIKCCCKNEKIVIAFDQWWVIMIRRNVSDLVLLKNIWENLYPLFSLIMFLGILSFTPIILCYVCLFYVIYVGQ